MSGSVPTAALTHGRHCPCTGCAKEDWTRPDLAPCGMHGPDCPAAYQPVSPPAPDGPRGTHEAAATVRDWMRSNHYQLDEHLGSTRITTDAFHEAEAALVVLVAAAERAQKLEEALGEIADLNSTEAYYGGFREIARAAIASVVRDG